MSIGMLMIIFGILGGILLTILFIVMQRVFQRQRKSMLEILNKNSK